MASLLQLIVSGIAMGFIYCLVAIEFTLIWNASSLINFGHDKFIMLGAYIFAGTMITKCGFNYFIALILLFIVMGLFGMGVAAGIFNPLKHMPSDIYAVMGTIMLAKIISEISRLMWGPAPFTLENFLVGTIRIGGIALPLVSIYIIIISIAFLIGLNLLFTKTRIGKAMRCVAQDKEAAALMGINVNLNIMLTCAFSSILCSIIGVLVIPLFGVDLNMANMIGIKGFAAGVVGGFGSIPGAIAGGLFIGILENLFISVGPSIYKDVIAFILLITFLILRPDGIIRKKAA
ncbi:branched-chain amino acid ABC transporter permease [Thermoanaerobacteraceae bacterium SP2]|nr:branched-chain amino acid ABC transporter permease [Thermoanaerobacteraceae bacterium SP2]